MVKSGAATRGDRGEAQGKTRFILSLAFSEHVEDFQLEVRACRGLPVGGLYSQVYSVSWGNKIVPRLWWP